MLTEGQKDLVKKGLWDYRFDDAEIERLFSGEASNWSMNREKILARLLISSSWYAVVSAFGLRTALSFLTDGTIAQFRSLDARRRFLFVRSAMEGYGR